MPRASGLEKIRILIPDDLRAGCLRVSRNCSCIQHGERHDRLRRREGLSWLRGMGFRQLGIDGLRLNADFFFETHQPIR
jgi:hypothetical protein